MQKEVGYLISILGIFLMAVGFGMIPLGFDISSLVKIEYVGGVGVALVGVGVVLSLSKGGEKKKNGEDEIPIYEGVGKKRRIVGYRKR